MSNSLLKLTCGIDEVLALNCKILNSSHFRLLASADSAINPTKALRKFGKKIHFKIRIFKNY